MDHDGSSPSPSDPRPDADEQRGRSLLDALHRDLAGESATVIAGRYVLAGPLGHGAHGTVHAARDHLTGETVAVKLLPPLVETDLVRLRGEIAALRLLRLPGVVHLFDEGTDHGRPFLVMERVDGQPFPGALPAGATRWTWDTLRAPALALLDTLARVHAAGLVHRDLKPRNVLVTAAGRPVLLDFGLSVGRALADDSVSDTSALGTPAYAAPEQVRGEPVDARADLYSFGVMLWEALAGRRPHDASRVSGILRARLQGPAESLARAAPGVPSEVAEVVDALLEVEREGRPRSAVEVAERLAGGEARSEGLRLPLAGRDASLAAVLAAVRAGRSVHVTGEVGIGRTRFLQEACARLEAEGRRTAWLQPASRPFESLAVLASWIDELEPASLEAALAATGRALRRALVDGIILVVDDVPSVDEWSRRALAELSAGTVLSSATHAEAPTRGACDRIELPRLRESDLAALFSGSDRLLHVHEDAARELHDRTLGLPATVHTELEAWVRAGLVEIAGSRLMVTRAAVDRLRGGLQVLPVAPPAAGPVLPLQDDLDELLAWIHLAWPNTDRTLLARISGRANWLLDAELGALAHAGATRELPDGRQRPLRASRKLADASWVDEARRRAHADLAAALSPGAVGRLYHLVAAGRDAAAAGEALVVARAHAGGGRIREAEVALGEGLRAARRDASGPAHALERSLIAEWVPLALSDISAVACDRLLYETSRSPQRDDELVHLEQLLRAAIAAYESDGPRALARASGVAPFAEAVTECWRQALRVRAVRRCSLAEEERVVAEACAWADGRTDDVAASRRHEWEGRLRYRQGRYHDAAALHMRAAERPPSTAARLSALLNAASALLEALELERCAEVSVQARELAAASRHALHEGRAEWLVRAAAYRRGHDLSPDTDLVEALERVGALDQAALAAMLEAAIAWRCGDRPACDSLAGKAARHWTGTAFGAGQLLARALKAVGGREPASPAELRGLRDDVASIRELELKLQTLALLARAGVPALDEARVLLAEVRASRRGAPAGVRLDVLSLDEISRFLTPEDGVSGPSTRA